jgi:putative transcription factor
MCGTEVPRTKLVMIEGAAVSVCQRCERFGSGPAVKTKQGQVMVPEVAQRLDSREKRRRERDVYATGEEKELALDYGERVRKARQKLGISQEDLGKQINEKKGVIVNIENGSMIPDDKVVRKLERALNISLRESLEADGEVGSSTNPGEMTLGDFIKTDKKKK